MANFEGLIRQALARQDSDNPAVREKIYQASRNALARMIATSRAQSPSAIQEQRKALEHTIRRIEAGYREGATPPPPASYASAPDRNPPPADELRVDHRPAADNESLFDDAGPATYSANGGSRRILAIAAIIILLVVIGWLTYSLVVTLAGTGSADWTAPVAGETGELDSEAGQPLVTLLSPVDTKSLQTAGRGNAEIVSVSGTDMIRLTSLRPSNQRDIPAEPILVNLAPGIVEQIAGRRVTVEILARSGSSGPATFAIQCNIAGTDACGRKRFRVGLSPEAIIFTMDIPRDISDAENPSFGINTDVTGSAAATGRGDPVDIVYARLRLPAN